MRKLKAEDQSWAAIVAFYSLIHVESSDIEALLLEFHRVLEPGGALLIAFHIGTETEHLDQWWEQPVDLDFHYHRTLDMVVHLQQAGFEPVSTYKRNPYPDVEAQTRRAYIVAESVPGTPPAMNRG
jgi:ubiquinone/menaquinone biosynthesis C-methylase UbiE